MESPVKRPLWRRVVNRLGCTLLFMVWLMGMVTPCFMATLLYQGEIVIERSDLPEHEIRLFLLSNADTRGFGLSQGKIKSGGEDEGRYCIVTSIDYLLWEGKSQPTEYCSCYEKSGKEWIPTSDPSCPPPEIENP